MSDRLIPGARVRVVCRGTSIVLVGEIADIADPATHGGRTICIALQDTDDMLSPRWFHPDQVEILYE